MPDHFEEIEHHAPEAVTEHCACGSRLRYAGARAREIAADWRDVHMHEDAQGDGWVEALQQQARVERALLVAIDLEAEARRLGGAEGVRLRRTADQIKSALAATPTHPTPERNER